MTLAEDRSRRTDLRGALSHWWDRKTRREAAVIAPYVDAGFYLKNNFDVASSGIEPSFHYAKYGWREGRDPSPSFSTKGYLEAHPRVALRGENPLLHFATITQASKADGHAEDESQLEREAEIVQDKMDATFYAATYPNYKKSGLTPERHYCLIGWRAGHDPAPDFSTSYYLSTNPDIKEAGVNPFWHYLVAGREEGRLPTHPGGWRHDTLSRQPTFEEICASWEFDSLPPKTLTAAELRTLLDAARTEPRLIVSIGHDDYRAAPGGVQLCIQLEERNRRVQNADYLNLHPWQPLPKLAAPDDDPIVCLVMNGCTLAHARQSVVNRALRQARAVVGNTSLVVHHLSGHAPEQIAALANGLCVQSLYFWLHDYFTLCTSYALQRNNVTACNAPDPSSNACGICLFGQERPLQLKRLDALFRTLDVHVVSPSEVALKFWKNRSDLTPTMTTVHPHVRLSETSDGLCAKSESNTRTRIAFVGTPAAHKGWPVFCELRRRLAADNTYEFVYFGSTPPGIDGVRHVPTHAKASAPQSVRDTMADHEVDVVLHWASWQETFSFSTYEALAAGAFVITNAGSGNVAAAVERYGRGRVLNSSEDLFELAKSGELKTIASAAKRTRAKSLLTMSFSDMTLDLIDEGELV